VRVILLIEQGAKWVWVTLLLKALELILLTMLIVEVIT